MKHIFLLLILFFANTFFSQNTFDYFDIEMEMKGRENYKNVTCDTLYYSKNIDNTTINETIKLLTKKSKFKLKDGSGYFKMKKNEKVYLISELEKLRTFEWDENLFSKSKAVKIKNFDKVFEITKKFENDSKVKMCSIIYTFSKPIYFRNNKFCLILYQENYSVNEAFINFNIYKTSDIRIPKEEYASVFFRYKN